MLTSARHLHDFPEQPGADGVVTQLGHAAQGCDGFIAHVLETLHDWQVRQAEREIDRYRRSVRCDPY